MMHATPLNLWMLGVVAAGRIEFPGNVAPLASAHVHRCFDLGLVEYTCGAPGRPRGAGWFTKRRLRLTPEGLVALADAVATRFDATIPIPEGPFTRARSDVRRIVSEQVDGDADVIGYLVEPRLGHDGREVVLVSDFRSRGSRGREVRYGWFQEAA